MHQRHCKLEGKITFSAKSYNGDVTRYDAIAAGSVEMANCAWGGAAFWPFNQMDVYIGCNGYDIQEIRSFDSRNTPLTLTYDFNGDGNAESVTDSYFNWAWNLGTHSETDSYKDSNGKEVTTSHTSDPTWDIGIDPEANKLHNRLYTLSRIEEGLLKLYNFAVVGTYATVSLFSQKINYATLNYNPMYGYGGVRWMTYNYDDAQWAAYVKAQGGTIAYE
jgi:oligopeptide transport system substrate-binding protein